MSQLVVITFADKETANAALTAVRGVEKSGNLSLSDTAVIVKDADGKVSVDNEWSSGVEIGAVAGGVLGLFTSFIFPVVGTIAGAALGALVGSKFDTGVDKDFVKDVSQSLTPGHSALFLLVRGGNPDAAIAAMRQFQGTVHQTTLSPELEQSLRDALKSKG